MSLRHATPALAPVTALLLALSAAGCGGTGSKAGPRPGCAAGTTLPTSWKINLIGGLQLADHPFSGQPATGLGGHFYLGGRDGGPDPDPTGAVVTLNGVAVPLETIAFSFDLMTARPAGVAAGGTSRVVATLGGACTSAEFTCPSFEITAPAEGAAIGPGETVTVGWSGSVQHPSVTDGLYRPAAAIDTYSAATTQRSESLTWPAGATIAAGASSVSLVAPAAAQGGYVVELPAPGPAYSDTSTGDVGICMVGCRVHLSAR